jgi:hypothetical protein
MTSRSRRHCTKSIVAAIESLEPRTLLTATPILVVPGLGGSLPNLSNLSNIAAVESLAGFITGTGVSPTTLGPETYDNTYTGLMTYLAAKPGYTLNDNLFFAAYDWRLPTAPADGTADGSINLSGVNMSSSTYSYTVQYLNYWINQARTHWIADNGSAAGFHVDIIAHSLGGVVTRAFLQSTYYAQNDAGVVNKLDLLASVNQGDASAIVVANQSVSAYFASLATTNSTYTAEIAAALTATGLGNESLVTFSPSIKDLYPTYSGATSNGTAPSNPLLTDLNANTGVLTSAVSVMTSYGTNVPTQFTVNLSTLATTITNSGDGVVPVVSSDLAGLGTTKSYSGVTHNELPGNATVENDIWTFFTGQTGTVQNENSGDDAIVNQLFVDILHRSADASGLSYYVGLLASGQSTGQVALALLQSPEAEQIAVTQAYAQILTRTPDSSGLSYGVGLLSGGGSIASLEATLAGSDEFYTKAGSTVAGFTAALFAHLFGRGPDSAGTQFVAGQLAAGTTRTQVAADLLGSTEALGDAVNSLYGSYLGRAADASGSALYVSQIAAGTSVNAIITQLVSSNDFFSIALGNFGTADQKFLRLSYLDLLGRSIDPAGAALFANELTTGATTRAGVTTTLTSSDEYVRNTVTGLFEAILGRAPDSTSLAFYASEIEVTGVAIDYVRAQLLASDEFLADQGGTVSGFTNGIYTVLLGRGADSSGASNVANELATGVSRLNVILGIINTTEHRAFLGGSLITRYLDRGYTTGDTTYYAGQLNDGVTEQGITDQIIDSAEFLALALAE